MIYSQQLRAGGGRSWAIPRRGHQAAAGPPIAVDLTTTPAESRNYLHVIWITWAPGQGARRRGFAWAGWRSAPLEFPLEALILPTCYCPPWVRPSALISLLSNYHVALFS
jgi:hypothetical protein